MGMSDDEFEKEMEEYRKSADGIHLSDEARERINQGILHRDSGGKVKSVSSVRAIVASAAVVAILVLVGVFVSALSGQESGQMISHGIIEDNELQSEAAGQNGTEQDVNKEDSTELTNSENNKEQDIDNTVTVDSEADNTEKFGENNENARNDEDAGNDENTGSNENDGDNNSDESDEIWLTAAQLLKYCENETDYSIQTCSFVSYKGTLMCSTDSDTAALHFKRDGDGEIIYNEDNAYDAYLVEEIENAIAIVVDGHVCVYEEMENITFTIDGVSYGISYALYDLIGTEEHSGNLIADENGVKVYEWLDAAGQVVEGKYFVDISDILVELMPDPYADGEGWAEFYWVATEIT